MSDLLICVDSNHFPAPIPHPFFLTTSVPIILCGDVKILNLPRVSLLNSRQSPRLNRNQAWFRKTLEALHEFKLHETVLISSLGTPAWDLLTWAAGRLGFPIILVFPAGSAQNFNVIRTKTILDFGLDDNKVLALRPMRLGRKRPSAEDSIIRDRWVMVLSQKIMPISLRPGGNLEGLLNYPSLPNSAVDRRFQIPQDRLPPAKKITPLGPIHLPDWYRENDYLIHWTRSCVGPFPYESRAEYFDRMFNGAPEPVEAADTLEHILLEGLIRASIALVRGKYPVVPFTERPPADLPRLIRWRSGLRHWTFEPYGIALNKMRLVELGARPVNYSEASMFHELSEEDKPFFQVGKSAGCDWTQEKEWRVRGDVRLDQFEGDELVLLVRDKVQADRIATQFKRKTMCLTDSR